MNGLTLRKKNMICPYCGQENREDLDICDFCGASLQVITEEPVSEVHSPEPPGEVNQSIAEPREPLVTQTQPALPPSRRIFGNKRWWIVGCIAFACLVFGCVAVVLGLYRFTKALGFLDPVTRNPVQTSTQAGANTPIPTTSKTQAVIQDISTPLTSRQLFYDDFSDPNSGWDQVDETDYSTNYYQNAYRIRVNTDMTDSWANPGGHNFGDVIIEADATKNGGPDDNDFGLICRYLDIDRYYYAIISSDGYYGISKSTSESTTILGGDSLVYSDAINQGFATNHIRFDCVGDSLTLSINGQVLDQQTDGEYTSGNVGLLAGTYDTPGTDILFDNFGVYAP